MKNDSITINLDFYKPFEKLEYLYIQSHYTHHGRPFSIQQINEKYLLEFPVAFLKQFKKHEIEHSMIFNSLEEALRIATLIFHGKAGEIENELPFDDYRHIPPIELYLELIPYFGKDLPKPLREKLKKRYDEYNKQHR